MKVLDLGSGPGDVAFLVAADIVGEAGSVVGIDLNPDGRAVRASRATINGEPMSTSLKAIAASATFRTISTPSLADLCSFTPVMSRDVATVARHVRPGGMVAFAEPEFRCVVGFTGLDHRQSIARSGNGHEAFCQSGQLSLHVR